MRLLSRPRAILRVERLEDRSTPAVVSVARTPSDPGAAGNWGFTQIGAPAAWDVTTGTGQTIVAVIDTGVDLTHPDLAGNLWTDPATGAHGEDFISNTTNPQDTDGHGTFVAGIIGAVGDNGVGVAGVEWHTRIMALRFMASDGGGYTSDAARAIDYAVAHGAKVVNLSWGGPSPDPALAASIGTARAAGVIVVTAAGNGGADTDSSPFYPASYDTQFDNVIAVAASDKTDALAGFSNFGAATVTLAAPGVDVESALPNDRYAAESGTSAAAPFVAGAVALLWDLHPDWSYQQILAKLEASVDPVPALAGKVATAGRLDVAKMVDAATAAPPIVPPPAPPVAGGPQVTNYYFAGVAAGTFDKVRLTFNEAIDPATLTAADITLSGPGGAIAIAGVSSVAGSGNTQFDVTFAPQSQAGGYAIRVGPDVRDPAGTTMGQPFSGSDSITGSSAPTVPPIVPPTTSPSGSLSFAAARVPLAIPDVSTATTMIVVNQDVTITSLAVQLNITHTYDSDLVVRLTGPGGQAVTLIDRRGGSGHDFAGTTLADSAVAGLSAGRAPFLGSFRPERPLAAFAGTNARGTWTLTVGDEAPGDVGTLNAAELDITGSPVAASPTGSPLAASPQVSVAFWNESRPDSIVPPAETPHRPGTRAVLGRDEPMPETTDRLVGWAESSRPTEPDLRTRAGLEDSAHPSEDTDFLTSHPSD
jgi:subtilisin family serine protease/subtilisin-like proprotein convertase family protein